MRRCDRCGSQDHVERRVADYPDRETGYVDVEYVCCVCSEDVCPEHTNGPAAAEPS